MSQERTRFPIQPEERRRTAKSFEDVATPPDDEAEGGDEAPQDAVSDRERGGDGSDQDKPDRPPHRRHK